MGKELETDVTVLGAGPAGYTAAIYAARANPQPTGGTELGAGVAGDQDDRQSDPVFQDADHVW